MAKDKSDNMEIMDGEPVAAGKHPLDRLDNYLAVVDSALEHEMLYVDNTVAYAVMKLVRALYSHARGEKKP